MNTRRQRIHILLQWVLITGGVLGVTGQGASITFAASQVAIATNPAGAVFVERNGFQQPALEGHPLYSGDSIETGVGARVTIIFWDGHRIDLLESTKVSLGSLRQVWGDIVGWLSPWQQGAGSTFFVETPNAYAFFPFSQPHFGMSYWTESETTVVNAYVGSVYVQNRRTGESRYVPEGYSTIITPYDTVYINEIRENALLRTLRDAVYATSSAPMTELIQYPRTSQPPRPGANRGSGFTLTIIPRSRQKTIKRRR